MRFTNILEDVLGHKSKIRLLRYLLNTELELTGRQISRVVGIHHRTAHLALKELSSFGIVVMQHTGKAIVYKINKKNLLVRKILKPIFMLEKNLISQMVITILRNIHMRIISAIVFGSVAKTAERGTSDIDILFLVSALREQIKLTEYLESIEYDFILKYGNKLSPLVFTIDEFKRRLRRKDRLVQNIVQSGKSVYGKTVQEVLIECQRKL